jgi:class 3 adenylate cyclase
LFADLAGFTTLSERLDAEDVAAVQEAYFGAVREALRRHGGLVEKFIGDAVMAVFGLPRTRDDDAERAVRAGLALVATVDALAGRLGLDESQLQLRVGVTSGEVAHTIGGVGETDRISGDVVNTAARLQAAAEPAMVLIDEVTALAVADVIETGPHDPLSLKGKAEPVRVAIARTLRPDRSRDAAMGSLRAPTIGRDEELALLRAALARVAAGASERWLIVAPPGVGKSRLLSAFVDAPGTARGSPAPVLWRTRLGADQSAPFDAVAGLLRAALGAIGTEDRELIAVAADRLRQAGLPARRIELLAERIGVLVAAARPTTARPGSSTEDRDLLFADWLEIVDILSAGAVQVWLVEDIHWSSADLRSFLDAAHAAGSRRLVVATSRPAILDLDPTWARHEPAAGRHRMNLPTLPGLAAATLIEALIGDAIPSTLVARIVDRSDGTPLFIEELLRTWISLGVLTRGSDGWQLRVEEQEVPLPPTVQAVYAAQIDDLPSDARTAARRASVAGRRFALAGLAALELSDHEHALDTLQRRDIVGDAGADPILGSTLAYRHALLREAGYASLARAERARFHIRLARWLEGVAGDDPSALAVSIAGHFEAALASAPALATDIGSDLDRAACAGLAAHWLEQAAEAAMNRGAFGAARELAVRSIELTEDGDRLATARRRLLLARATKADGDMDAARTVLEDATLDAQGALAAARVGGETAGVEVARHVVGSVAESLARILIGQLRFDGALRVARDELELIGRARDDPTSRLLAVSALATTFLTNGPAALPDAELAVEIADELDDPLLKLHVADALVHVRDETGQASPEDWDMIARLAADTGDWPRSIDARLNAARHRIFDDPAAGVPLLDEIDALAEAFGLAEQRGWVDQARCGALFSIGRWDDAIAAGRRAIDRAKAGGFHRVAVRTWFPLVFMASARGDLELLGEAANWSAEHAVDFPDSPYSRLMHGAMAVLFARAGFRQMPEISAASIEPALDLPPIGLQQTQALGTILERWIEQGRLSDTAAALAVVGERYEKEPALSPGSAAAIDLMRAELASRTGFVAKAVALTRNALGDLRSMHVPFGTLLAIRLLDRLDEATDAEVAEAASIEVDLGIPSSVRPT